MLTAFFASCQQDAIESPETTFKGNGFYLKPYVKNVETGVETRSIVDPEAGETDVKKLYLLFFEYTNSGEGEFIEAMEVENPVMSANNAIDFRNTGLNSGTDYSILAFANIGVTGKAYLSEDYDTLDEFLGSFDGMTESEAMERLMHVTGATGNNETDDTHAIKASELIMSASATKEGDVSTLEIALTRGVSRIDSELTSSARTNYNIVSVSVWNGAKTTPLAYVRTDAPQVMERFYGMKYAGDGVDVAKGGLYAFENFVAEPKMGDKRTTCAIIGLKPMTTDAHRINGTDATMYYRVNINRTGGSQNLKRNYVYNISVSSVREAGYNSEDEAYKGADNRLGYEINNWGVDTDGTVLTDGTHILGLPFRKVVLSPDGEMIRRPIFTSGPESTPPAVISQSVLPAGLSAGLSGKELTISATPLGATETERRGSIEIHYGGLRGTIDIIQSASEDQFLELNKSNMLVALAQGPDEVPGGRIVVTSSGPWVAKIYNNGVGGNPGFSFKAGGAEQTVLYKEGATNGNNGSNEIAVFTTGTNPDNIDRYAFVIVSLIDDESINRSLPLRQLGIADISINPKEYETTGIKFTRDGTPVGLPNAQPGNPFVITVAPGTDEDGNLNSWTAVFDDEPTASTFFKIVDSHGTEESVRVSAIGENTTGMPYSANLKISNGGSTKTIKVTQEGAPVEVSQAGSLGIVPALGTTSTATAVQFRVSLAGAGAGTTYTAEIVSSSHAGHEAFFINSSGQTSTTLSATDLSGTFFVGFPRVHFPNVDVTHTAVVRVTVTGASPLEFTVSQEQLHRKNINLLDGRSDKNFGSLGDDGYYFKTYNTSLTNSFGAGNPIKSSPVAYSATYSGGSISSGFNYLHAGSRKDTWELAAFATLNSWRLESNGVIVYVQDRQTHNSTKGLSNALLSAVGISGVPNDKKLMCSLGNTNNRVMKYITEDGPFGAVSSFSWQLDIRNVLVTGHNGVPVVVASNGQPVIVVDPANSFVFIGECEIFNGTTSNNIKLMQNLQAFILMSAQYGKHFLDIFTDDSIPYPFSPTFVYP